MCQPQSARQAVQGQGIVDNPRLDLVITFPPSNDDHHWPEPAVAVRGQSDIH